MGDVNGDGRADFNLGTAFGGLIRIFDGPTLVPLVSAFPYGPLFPGGVNVAAGDVNGDGIDEVAFAPRSSGGPVRVYTMQAELLIEGHPFNGVQGVNLAMHDVNGDGHDDLVMGAGAGATPRLRTFSILDRTLLLDIDAFDPGFTGGVFVATPSSARTRFTSPASTTFTAGTAGTFSVTTARRQRALSVGGTLPAGRHVHRQRQRHGDPGRHAGRGHRRQLRADVRGHARRTPGGEPAVHADVVRSRRRSPAPARRPSPSAWPTPSR